MVKTKKFVLKKYFDGPPKTSDFDLVEEELPALKDGEFLAEAVFLSVDPYMRAYAHNIPLGSTMIGQQVAKIVESKNKDYPVGKYVAGKFDWRTHTISTGAASLIKGAGSSPPPRILPDFGGLPLSYALGILGMPGATAYFGFLDVCEPKEGDTVVVSGAAGAVGSIVGQIAKIKGCRVIGIAGSDEKGRYLVEDLGFDGYINYKTQDVDERLAKLAPEGVNCYFDNVAGEISSAVIKNMAHFGRISVCGSISSYNADVTARPKASVIQTYMLTKELVMQGFQVYLYEDRFSEAIHANLKWIKEGKLKYKETVTEGFENMPKAFIEMLEGKNLGKAVVRAHSSRQKL